MAREICILENDMKTYIIQLGDGKYVKSWRNSTSFLVKTPNKQIAKQFETEADANKVMCDMIRYFTTAQTKFTDNKEDIISACMTAKRYRVLKTNCMIDKIRRLVDLPVTYNQICKYIYNEDKMIKYLEQRHKKICGSAINSKVIETERELKIADVRYHTEVSHVNCRCGLCGLISNNFPYVEIKSERVTKIKICLKCLDKLSDMARSILGDIDDDVLKEYDIQMFTKHI